MTISVSYENTIQKSINIPMGRKIVSLGRIKRIVVMEFKGTKGEWIVNKGNNVVSKHNLPIAIVFDGYTPHGSFKNENENDRKANAKLISKAPELLELLNHFIEISDELSAPDHLIETFANLYANAFNTIQEATE